MDIKNLISTVVSNATRENPISAENISLCVGHITVDEVERLMRELMQQSDKIVKCQDGYYCRNDEDDIVSIANKNVLDKQVWEYIIQHFDNVVDAQIFIAKLSEIAEKQNKKIVFQNMMNGTLQIIAENHKENLRQNKSEIAVAQAKKLYEKMPPTL